jgi:hypothetical protein
MAISLEYRIRILNLSFDEYSRYFQGTCSNWGFFLPEARSRRSFPWLLGRGLRVLLVALRPLLARYGRCLGVQMAALADNARFMFVDGSLVTLAQSHYLVFYEGWPIASNYLLKRHADAIRRFFSLAEPYAGTVREYLTVARSGCHLLIGIHIRQGDYLTWNDGRYYFRSERYATLMRHIIAKHPGKTIRFFVCSNVEQDWNVFAEFSVMRGIKGVVEDMYILAGCDEIYGPQSSYSGWAAFYGEKPLYWVTNPETFESTAPDVIS